MNSQLKFSFLYSGARRIIEVFDCDTHQPEQMSVHHWVRYYTGNERTQILNVTSLEFSHTGLERIVDCPTVVSKCVFWWEVEYSWLGDKGLCVWEKGM